MGMIQQIVNDAKAIEAEAVRAEEDAQKAYEDFVKETNASAKPASKTARVLSRKKSKDMVNRIISCTRFTCGKQACCMCCVVRIILQLHSRCCLSFAELPGVTIIAISLFMTCNNTTPISMIFFLS